MPDGSRLEAGDGGPRFTLVFRTDAAVRQTFACGHMGRLEADFDQEADLEGDLGAAFAAGMAPGFDRQFQALGTVENR